MTPEQQREYRQRRRAQGRPLPSGPAFPHDYQYVELDASGRQITSSERQRFAGMSLRDYFAAAALPACYAQICRHCDAYGWPEGWRTGIADDAYEMADAMLKAR